MSRKYAVITKNSYHDLNGTAVLVDGKQIPYHLSKSAVERILFHNFRHLLLELHIFRQRRLQRKRLLAFSEFRNPNFTEQFFNEWKKAKWIELHEHFSKVSSKFRELRGSVT